MKTVFKIIIYLYILNGTALTGQIPNWNNLSTKNGHIVNVNVGLDYGLVYGIGYGYFFNRKLPVLLNMEYSFPSGNNLTDDFKTKIGGKVRLCKINHFQFSVNVNGVFRKYENNMVKLINFGSDISGVAGYYKSKWFVAGEFGFDKAIVTYFKHSRIYKDNFPKVLDGWYEPATGGNVYYGLITGISFNKHDICFKIGKVISQDFKTKPLIPYYAQLGYNFKFSKVSNIKK